MIFVFLLVPIAYFAIGILVVSVIMKIDSTGYPDWGPSFVGYSVFM